MSVVDARLAPEVRKFIAAARLSPAEASPAMNRKVSNGHLDALFAQQRGRLQPVADIADHLIAVTDGEIKVRVYRPHIAAPRPAFVHFHGGGFQGGSIDQLFYRAKARELCHGAGVVVVDVEYRLAPEHRFPIPVHDAYSALMWTIANAAVCGIDQDQIAIGGDSAGGNLAAAVALMARDRDGPKLALQLLEIPALDLAEPERFESWRRYARGFGLDDDDGAVARAYLRRPRDAFDAYASPLRAADLGGLAPAHIMTAEFDILRDAGEEYGRRLQAAGVRTSISRHSGQIHGGVYLYPRWKPARIWMDELIGVLAGAFDGRYRDARGLSADPLRRGSLAEL